MTRWLQAAKQATDALTKPTELKEFPRNPVLSVVSVVSEWERAGPAPPNFAPRVAEVAIVATPPARKPEPKPSTETFPHGLSVTGQPKTWMGRIVPLDDWKQLSDWDRDGSSGKLWNGVTRNGNRTGARHEHD